MPYCQAVITIDLRLMDDRLPAFGNKVICRFIQVFVFLNLFIGACKQVDPSPFENQEYQPGQYQGHDRPKEYFSWPGKQKFKKTTQNLCQPG